MKPSAVKVASDLLANNQGLDQRKRPRNWGLFYFRILGTSALLAAAALTAFTFFHWSSFQREVPV